MEHRILQDRLRELDREVAALRSDAARRPVRDAKSTGGGRPINVYKFRSCMLPTRYRYITNPACATHLPGGADASFPVALILGEDGTYECWQLIEVATTCVSGDCVRIEFWLNDCTRCGSFCWLLTPCIEGDSIVVRGVDWGQYYGKVVYVRNVDEEVDGCYTVGVPENCDDVNDEIRFEDIRDHFYTCAPCAGCYQLTSCAAELDVRYIGNDLAFLLSEADPEDVIGQTIRDATGACWEVTDYSTICENPPAFFELSDPLETVETCDQCCYLFTPCDEESEDEPFVARTDPSAMPAVPLEPMVGNTVMLAGGVCYTVSRHDDCAEATIGIPTLEGTYDECECCVISRWQKCGTSDKIRTKADLCAYMSSAFILKRAEDGFCYEYVDNAGSETIVDFTVEEDYPTCALCLDPRYKLTPACTSEGCGSDSGDCGDNLGGGGGAVIVTEEDLRGSIGQYVKVRGQCYVVSFTTDTVTEAAICWSGPFASCDLCNAAESRLPLLTYRNGAMFITTVVGNFRVCDDELISGPCVPPEEP